MEGIAIAQNSKENRVKRDNSDTHRINEQIRVPKVRLVGENIENPGIYSIDEALKIAEKANLDLVEIAPYVDPPVCRVMDYQKFLYEQKKKAKEQKAKSAKIEVKEIRFSPHTDEHDFEFKKNHAIKFLKEGAKIKAHVFFKGRTILFKEQGEIVLLRLAAELEEYGKVEQLPKLEGKRMTIVISPKKTK